MLIPQCSGSRRSRRARNFCRVLQTGHCHCWSSLGIRRSQELGSSRSADAADFLGWRALEQRNPTAISTRFLDVQQTSAPLLPDTQHRSNFCLFGHFQGIIYFDAQVSHSTLQLGDQEVAAPPVSFSSGGRLRMPWFAALNGFHIRRDLDRSL